LKEIQMINKKLFQMLI